jgi:dnd system-associated protein 4
MPEQISRDDRIAIDPEMHEIFKGLSDGTDPEEVPFGQLKDVFLMAACLGYARKKRRPLPVKTRDIIRLETFSQSDLPVLYALAIATTGDVDILDQGYGFLTIAEEYANEGIHILKENLLNQRGRPLWNLVDLVRSEIHSD